MFRGFNLKDFSTDMFGNHLPYYVKKGEDLCADYTNKTKKDLSDFKIKSCEILSASAIKDVWFPVYEDKFDIFISHSHDDEKLAYAIAGYINEVFGLNCFVDGKIWSSADGLLFELDQLNQPRTTTFDYKKRNFSTSEIHSLLMIAIMQMINNCECLFFLNTPKSLSIDVTEKKLSESPWLFIEIGISKLIPKGINSARRHNFLSSLTEAVLAFDIDTTHLIDLHFDSISEWEETYKLQKKTLDLGKKINPSKTLSEIYPLDILYSLYPEQKTLLG